MKAAHPQYRAMGFDDYSESETDKTLNNLLVYMEMRI